MKFKPFNEMEPVRIYWTTMPHWRQAGCTYFVTHRLADSIPEGVFREWEYEKRLWLKARGIEIPDNLPWHDGFLKLNDVDRFQFLKHFNRQLNTYLDQGRGKCQLREPRFSRIVVESWRHFDGQQYQLGDLVVMPNHVHLLLTPLDGFELEDILQSRKTYLAREIHGLLGETGTLWQKHSYDHIVRDPEQLLALQGYIAENPAKAKLQPDEYQLVTYDWRPML